MAQLSSAAVSSLPESVAVPGYDRGNVRVGIVHIGVGGFHRSHQAFYLHRLLEAGLAEEWGICGVGLLPGDRRMQQVLAAQDHLYTLVLKHPDGTAEAEVVGSLVDYLYAPDDPEAVLERMAAPQTRVVSLTVTEGGYNLQPATGEFDAQNPAVVRDLQPGAVPGTVFGLVVEALVRRRERGLPPFTVVSCDNIEGNGDVARYAFSAYAALRDAELGDWVRREVRFPNSMVDRITPGTTEADRALVAERYGYEDGWPVVCEPFIQWVLQDDFSDGRPPLESAGVQVVDDVRPYELMKLRLLNAGHQAMSYLGYLAGYRYVHEVCADPLFVEFLLGYMENEAGPTLAPVPGVDLPEYRRTLIERFANPHISDTLARQCLDASEKMPKFLLPVVGEQLAAGGDVARCALVVAAWARYSEGVDERGDPIEVVDPRRDRLRAAAADQRDDPLAFLRDRDLFGDLVDDARFSRPYTAAVRSLRERGARATLERLGPDGGVAPA